MLTFMGCAKEKHKLDAMGKFFDCLGDSSKCEKLKNSVEEQSYADFKKQIFKMNNHS